jgi:type VI secretion system protein VasD
MSATPFGPARRRQFLGLLAAAVTSAALAACGSKPKPEAAPKEKPVPELRVEVIAAPDANRDPSGRALPIVVRLYELKGEGAFAGADFFSLYDRAPATLGGDLIAREEVTLVPGQRRLVVHPLNPAASHLGVVAAFRDIDRAGWRALVALTPDQTTTVQVEVRAAAVAAQLR